MKESNRVIETNVGIQDGEIVEQFDQMMRAMAGERRRTIEKMKSLGIDGGCALEIGPGPGLLGIDWLKASPGARLKALEISANMAVKRSRTPSVKGSKTVSSTS